MVDPSLGAVVAGIAGVGFLAYFFLGSFLTGAGYEPTGAATAATMLALPEVGPEDTVLDLGAGTGALVVRAVRDRGARAIAVENEPIRFLVLRWRRRRLPEPDRLEVRRANLFATELRGPRVIFAFLWPTAMERLRPKLERELSPGTWVVSHAHAVPGWTPTRQQGEVYAYRWPECRERPGGLTAGGRGTRTCP